MVRRFLSYLLSPYPPTGERGDRRTETLGKYYLYPFSKGNLWKILPGLSPSFHKSAADTDHRRNVAGEISGGQREPADFLLMAPAKSEVSKPRRRRGAEGFSRQARFPQTGRGARRRPRRGAGGGRFGSDGNSMGVINLSSPLNPGRRKYGPGRPCAGGRPRSWDPEPPVGGGPRPWRENADATAGWKPWASAR